MKHFHIKKSVIYYLIYLGFLTYFETLLRILTLHNSFDLMPFIMNLWVALILTIITLSFKTTRSILFVMLFLLMFISASQVYYFYFFDTFYTAYSFMRAGMVAGNYYREIIVLIQENLHILFFYALPLIGLAFFRKKLSAARLPMKKILIGFMAFIILY